MARSMFKHAFLMLLLVWVSITVTDIYQTRINWDQGDAAPPIPEIGGKTVEPYHFWGLWLPYATMVTVVLLTYHRHSGDTKRTVVLGVMALLFMWAISDVAHYIFQGSDTPTEYTWLYPPFPSSVAGSTMKLLAAATAVTIGVLYLRYRNE